MKIKNEILNKITEFIGNKKSISFKGENNVVYLTDLLSAHFGMDRRRFYRTVYRMIDADYIKFKRDNSEARVSLSSKGEVLYRRIALNNLLLKKENVWDKKWYAISFDIPEKFKKARRSLSFILRKIGCYKFQNSVFVYPFDCRKEIYYIADFYSIRKYVSIIRVISFDGEEDVRKFFEI